MKLITALAATMFALTLTACGDDDDDGGGGEDQSSAAPLAIVATDKGIQAPASVEAGVVEISLQNEGKQNHEAQLIRLDDGHTADEALKAITSESSKIPDWFVDGGGVGTVKPGGEARTVTQALEPGTWAILDTDAQKPQSASLEVTGEPVDAELPEAEATVTSSEYKFETSGLKPGSNTILHENAGKELHHVIASPVKPDATAEAVLKFFETEEKSADPFLKGEAGDVGTSVLDSGQSQVTDLELEQGKYAFMCFIPDRAGGPPHAAKGMITIEEIK